MSKRKHYDNAFKVQTVKLAREIGQSKACNEINLPENTIYGWMHAYRQGKLEPGPGTQTPARALTMNEELIELRRQVKVLTKENKRLRDENEFLEEASAFFAASRRKSAKT
jgi:transposase